MYPYNSSDHIHKQVRPCNLAESETMYCHFAVWPFLKVASSGVTGLTCDFSVGETRLNAMPSDNDKSYNADGRVYIANSGLELLLLEASGPYRTHTDKCRHVFDHIKGAFGCYSMLAKIIGTYNRADAKLLKDVRVIFIHTSSKDEYIRCWVMRPVLKGEFVSFERFSKVSIDMDRDNKKSVRQVIQFFIGVKHLLNRSCQAIEKLKDSDDDYQYLNDEEKKKRVRLDSLLKCTPLKPSKAQFYKNISTLDPVSDLGFF